MTHQSEKRFKIKKKLNTVPNYLLLTIESGNYLIKICYSKEFLLFLDCAFIYDYIRINNVY